MSPPLAGRPPFATDEPDTVYETPVSQRRYRQPKPPNPNDRTSAYDMYDSYLNGNENDTESSAGHGSYTRADTTTLKKIQHSKQPIPQHLEIPNASKHALLAAAAGILTPPASPKIAAPRPGYVTSIVTLDMEQPERAPSSSSSARRIVVNNALQQHSQPQSPRTPNTVETPHHNPSEPPNSNRPTPYPNPPAFYDNQSPPHVNQHPPNGQQSHQHQHRLPNDQPPNYNSSQYPHPLQMRAFGASTPLPTTPHPLQPSLTPIEPVFCREMKGTMLSGEEKQPIMRSTKDLPLPGQRDDKFWRRFSTGPNEQQTRSSWLSKTQRRSARMGVCIWIAGLVVVLAIGGGIGFVLWKNRASTGGNEIPRVVGGSSNQTAGPSSSSSSARSSSTSIPATNSIVTPTLTIAYRGLPTQSTSVVLVVRDSNHRRHRQSFSRFKLD